MDAKVTVHLTSDGSFRGVDVEGDLDREHLVAETPGKPPPLPDDNSSVPSSVIPFG